MSKELLKLARNSIAEEFNLPPEPIEIPDEWKEKRGSFVTITKNDKLRGCIGSLSAYQELYKDIMDNAKSAAFRDPRFFPVTEDEFDKIKIEVSVLSDLKEIKFKTQEEILEKIVPFEMGLYLKSGYRSGTFLPQVWEHYPEPEDFFNHLKNKAGLPSNYFSDDMELYYYTVEKWKE